MCIFNPSNMQSTHNVMVLGSGAREHAIVNKIRKSSIINTIYVYPGNDAMDGGKISLLTISNDIKNNDLHQYLATYCLSNDIKIVIVGPEQYLVDGISDVLKAKGIGCFGPSKDASIIEGSKIFSKKFMVEHQIPTAKFTTNHGTISEECLAFMQSRTNNIPEYVIKLDKLAGGKGVFLPKSNDEALSILQHLINEDVIIEDKLEGEEVSVMGFCNGKDIVLMPQSQDHKRIYDNDIGPNTGGMGAYAPARVLDDYELEEVRQHMLKVVTKLNYVGVLYAGLMKTHDGEIYFLEFNCRFGDPEAQVLLELLDSDLYTIMTDCVIGNNLDIKWKSGYCGNVVLSHELYPESKSHELVPIKYDNKKNIQLYWANVMDYDGELYTSGGRVGSYVCYSDNSLRDAFECIYNNIYNIEYPGIYYRRDIGIRELTRPAFYSRHINIGILGSTKGTSLELLLNSTDKLNAKVSVVISNKKDAFILDRARNKGISSIYLPFNKSTMNKEEYDRQIVNLFRLYKVNVVYLIGYNRIVTPVLINEYRDNIFNIHPSLLPIGKGLWNQNVHQHILENKYNFTGCTLHHVTEDVDAGKILLQRQLKIDYDKVKDPETLKGLIQELESQVIVDSVKILSNEGLNYKKSGVDVDKGNSLVKSIKGISAEMNKKIGGFCAFYEHNGKTLGAATDGVGTKLELAIKENTFDTIGIDLVAMSVNDLMVCGVRPMFFLDYIAIDKLDVAKCESIIKGINKGCEMSGCQLIGGETAEMKGLYWKDKFDLAGFAVGEVIEKLPREINEGNYIYGIKSSGIHSNGYSLVNQLLEDYHGEIDLKPFLEPTRIYSELIPMLKHYGHKLCGMAHITGGGIIDNLPRILPNDLTFEIKLWEFPEIFQWIQTHSKMSQMEMLRTFNCGYGIILVFNQQLENPEKDGMDYLGRIVKGNQFKFL